MNKSHKKKGGFTLLEMLMAICAIFAICAVVLNLQTSTSATTARIATLGLPGPDAIPIVGMTNPTLNTARGNYNSISSGGVIVVHNLSIAMTGTNDGRFDRIFPHCTTQNGIYANISTLTEVSCTSNDRSSFMSMAAPGEKGMS